MIFFLLLLLSPGCRNISVVSEKNSFEHEFKEIFSQQYQLRKNKYLNDLQQEYSKAVTLSNINSLELLLNNPELSEAEKNRIILKNFDRALLYMQIMLFPAQREKFLQSQIKNELLFETASIFLHNTLCNLYSEKNTNSPPSDRQIEFHNRLNNIRENQKIEYTSLRINDATSPVLPEIIYPCMQPKNLISLEDFRKMKKSAIEYGTSAWIYESLSNTYGEKLPLLLLKLLFKTPHELNLLPGNNDDLKADFAALLTEMVWIWQSNLLYTNMLTASNLENDLKATISDTNASPQVLQSLFDSILACELTYLKMICAVGVSPFEKIPAPEKSGKYLFPARLETLNLILKDMMRKL